MPASWFLTKSSSASSPNGFRSRTARTATSWTACPAPTYHIVANPPKKEGICDICGKELTIRKDDKPETVKDRLATYHAETEPLKGFYEARGILSSVENKGSIDATNAAVMEVLTK